MKNQRSGMPPLFQSRRRIFPDPAAGTIDGIVAMGDYLNIATLFEAYSFGIFPWPHPDLPTLWYCPEDRGILDFSQLHVPRRLRKEAARSSFEITFDQAFSDVIAACAGAKRPGQDGTWITTPLTRAYVDFHRAGYAHSLEVWRGEHLVGGVYGVYVAGSFSGESMFYRESGASKIGLLCLIEFLRRQGLAWMDIQMVTPLTEQFGGDYIPKKDFLQRLENSKATAQALTFPIGRTPVSQFL